MNLEDNMHDEQINEIFRYWSREEMKLYYSLMLQQIEDEKDTTEDSMWQQPTYKLVFEEAHGMLRQHGKMEDLHQQLKTLRFEG